MRHGFGGQRGREARRTYKEAETRGAIARLRWPAGGGEERMMTRSGTRGAMAQARGRGGGGRAREYFFHVVSVKRKHRGKEMNEGCGQHVCNCCRDDALEHLAVVRGEDDLDEAMMQLCVLSYRACLHA